MEKFGTAHKFDWNPGLVEIDSIKAVAEHINAMVGAAAKAGWHVASIAYEVNEDGDVNRIGEVKVVYAKDYKNVDPLLDTGHMLGIRN